MAGLDGDVISDCKVILELLTGEMVISCLFKGCDIAWFTSLGPGRI